MNSHFFFIYFLPVLLLWPTLSFASTDVRTARSVDLNRYLGRWYQIAAVPQFFQRNCASNTTAEYSLVENDRIQVFNSCTDKQGDRISSVGRGKIVDPKTNAKLKVTFLKVGMWLYLFGGNYWIIELDPHYQWAVVGEGSRQHGWILARSPSLEKTELISIAEKIKAQGYELCAFTTEIQRGGLEARQPLCDYIK